MPQGSSAVRPTNGLYLLPFFSPSNKIHREVGQDKDLSGHTHTHTHKHTLTHTHTHFRL